MSREASKLWKKVCSEMNVEIKLLLGNWKYILGGIVFQVLPDRHGCGITLVKNFCEGRIRIVPVVYIHGLAARGVHYLHRPGPVLQDLGFFLIPELGQQNSYISESTFGIIFFSFIPWTFHSFVYQNKKFYTVLLWCRVLACLVLPGPNYHCREGSKLSRLPSPKSAYELLLLNFTRGVFYGCGDLILSSHMIFILVFVNTYHQYGTKRFIKQCGWLLAVIQSVLIIASRKHYTVDVVVAWYTVNLVIFFVNKRFPELPDRSVSSQQILPVISKGKEVKSKEEQYNLLNGSTTNGAHR